jgi:hypothetical protein
MENEIVVKRLEMNEADMDALDVKAVLDFAEHLIFDAARIWREANIDQKQRFQQVCFPEGMTFADGTIGTTATCLFFNQLQLVPAKLSNVG